MACKEGQFDVVEQFKTFSINLNAQHVNGMTHFDMFILLVWNVVQLMTDKIGSNILVSK